MQPRSGLYTVGDFMTRKEDLHVVKPTTTVDEGIFHCCFMFYFKAEVFSFFFFFICCERKGDFIFYFLKVLFCNSFGYSC